MKLKTIIIELCQNISKIFSFEKEKTQLIHYMRQNLTRKMGRIKFEVKKFKIPLNRICLAVKVDYLLRSPLILRHLRGVIAVRHADRQEIRHHGAVSITNVVMLSRDGLGLLLTVPSALWGRRTGLVKRRLGKLVRRAWLGEVSGTRCGKGKKKWG